MSQQLERSMNDDLDQFEKNVDKILHSFFPPQNRYRPIAWHPPTDVYETDDAVVVKIEIAGMRPEDFEIAYTDRVLTVRGERRDTDANKTGCHLLEVTYGEFEIQIALPGTYVESQIEARYEDGFLYVTLPKPGEQQHIPVRIRVK